MMGMAMNVAMEAMDTTLVNLNVTIHTAAIISNTHHNCGARIRCV
jgi:hypothetical protein